MVPDLKQIQDLGLKTVLFLFLLMQINTAFSKERPNVVFILTDDQGYGEIAAHGNKFIKTPNLDKLWDEGVRLTDFHVNSVCAPSRAAFVTGRYASRTGVWHTLGSRNIVNRNEKTIGDFFKTAGYSTMMIGKWHLGDNYPYRPEDRGFDEVFRIGGGSIGQTPDFWGNSLWNGNYWNGEKWIKTKGFCTDVQFEKAFDFIKQNKEKPFFAYIATTAPHSPIGADKKYIQPYLDMGLSKEVSTFYGMVTNIDENVGRLRKFLKDKGLEKNTILIFATDNGTACDKKGDSFNAWMRGKKGSNYDGGHRVPFFIYWPDGKIMGGHAIDHLTAHIDLLPTLLDACNIENYFNVKFDGISLLPFLQNKNSAWPHRTLITESKVNDRSVPFKSSAVMTHKWRLVQGKELFDIEKDSSQKTDIANGNEKIVNQLADVYQKWYNELNIGFANISRIPVLQKTVCKLNAMDLISDDCSKVLKTVWNQKGVKNGEKVKGLWALNIEERGIYRISLYRWPAELAKPLNEVFPKSKKLNIESAWLKIGENKYSAQA
ncbi:MAG: arylsulfatase, partial [Prolixibacteraceae bacterium]|nr:arylsulfatase [Prolixibacteraceae bacterium]